MHKRAHWLIFIAVGCIVPALAAAQDVTVSGVVMPQGRLVPIRGATVRLSDLSPATTNENGRFERAHVPVGRYTVRVQAVGYRLSTFEVTLTADTTLQIALEPLPVQLDTVVIGGGTVTIRGKIRDSASKAPLYDAEVRVRPGARRVGALSGQFRVGDVPMGDVTLFIAAHQHLPRQITFVAHGDTSLVVDLPIDSVGVRMFAMQAKRLQTRSNSVALSHRQYDRAAISQSGAPTIGIMLHRLAPRRFPDYAPWPDPKCLFLDDEPTHFGFLVGLAPNLIERIEVFSSDARMVRVYSTRYMASLIRQPSLPKILYLNTGLTPWCS